jgi:hypothetical protein
MDGVWLWRGSGIFQNCIFAFRAWERGLWIVTKKCLKSE